MISQLFNSLSIKYRKENDLSDITWAMCQACISFRNAFLRFFFRDFDITADIIIEREKSEDDSRPDFVIYCNGEAFIIENKIYDTNHHFGQYDNAFNVIPQRFGYITNYEISDKKLISDGYPIRTWEQLYDSFMSNLPENNDDNRLWKGYLCYVKSVCNLIKIESPMRLDGIYSLYSLIEILKKLCLRDEQDFQLEFQNSYVHKMCGGRIRNGETGINFVVRYKNIKQDNEIWGWIGLFYDTVNPFISIIFYNNPGWGKGFCDMLTPFKAKWASQEYFEKPYNDGSYLFFELSKFRHNEFNNLTDIKLQEELLKNFMDEVLRYPFTLSENNSVF